MLRSDFGEVGGRQAGSRPDDVAELVGTHTAALQGFPRGVCCRTLQLVDGRVPETLGCFEQPSVSPRFRAACPVPERLSAGTSAVIPETLRWVPVESKRIGRGEHAAGPELRLFVHSTRVTTLIQD